MGEVSEIDSKQQGMWAVVILDVRLRERSTWVMLAGVVASVWLMAAPDVLDYGGAASTNAHIAGPLALTCSFIAVWEILRGVRFANALIALWLIFAPWVLGYDDTGALVSDRLVGLVLLLTVLLGGPTGGRFGGGWRALRPID